MHLHRVAAILTMAIAVVAVTPLAARADGFDARPVVVETRDGLGAIVITNPGDRKIYLETPHASPHFASMTERVGGLAPDRAGLPDGRVVTSG